METAERVEQQADRGDGAGRAVAASDVQPVQALAQRFGELGYVFPALMREVATSRAFQTAPPRVLAVK